MFIYFVLNISTPIGWEKNIVFNTLTMEHLTCTFEYFHMPALVAGKGKLVNYIVPGNRSWYTTCTKRVREEFLSPMGETLRSENQTSSVVNF